MVVEHWWLTLHDLLIIPNCCLPFKSTILRTRHSHNFKLVPYQPRIDVYKYSFLSRTVPEWNRLDDEIIETDCVEEFKQKLAPSMYIVKYNLS